MAKLLPALIVSASMLSTVVMANDEQAPVTTSVDKIIASNGITQCAKPLSSLAADIIGSNSHRLMLETPSADVNKALVKIYGLIQYRDRQAHVSFTASANKGGEGECLVNYHETFTLQVPCVVAREEVFKKWIFKGKLSDTTSVFEHRRDSALKAYTSSAGDNSYCLVSQQKSIVQ